MNDELRDKYDGKTVDEYLDGMTDELSIDAVGLWQIVPAGRLSFGLSGDALIAFVRKGIAIFLSKGAKPVVGATDYEHNWALADYGDKPEAICDAIIAQWLNSGRDPDGEDVWFALPDIYEETFEPGEREKILREMEEGGKASMGTARTGETPAPETPKRHK
jgi:hypothetical protein